MKKYSEDFGLILVFSTLDLSLLENGSILDTVVLTGLQEAFILISNMDPK